MQTGPQSSRCSASSSSWTVKSTDITESTRNWLKPLIFQRKDALQQMQSTKDYVQMNLQLHLQMQSICIHNHNHNHKKTLRPNQTAVRTKRPPRVEERLRERRPRKQTSSLRY
jgi:hypothetical protein